MFSQSNNQGISLMETIIYVALIGVVMIAFVYFALSLTLAEKKNFSFGEVQANSRQIIEAVGQRIRGAVLVNTSTSVFGVDAGVLSLEMSDSQKNPTVIKLSPVEHALLIVEGVNTTTITTDKVYVEKLFFTDLSSSSPRGNIGIDLTVNFVSSTSQEYKYSQSIYSVFDLR